jgi:tetratricopeptide (TPR) repeat protein
MKIKFIFGGKEEKTKVIAATSSDLNPMIRLGIHYRDNGNPEGALKVLFTALETFRRNKDKCSEAYCLNVIGSVYLDTGDSQLSLRYLKESVEISQRIHDRDSEGCALVELGLLYRNIGNLMMLRRL